MAKKYQINLIKKPEMSLTDRVFYFIFHYFRYILVLTQITVVGVFFYRFTVDQGIIDTKEAINNKVAMLRVVRGIVNEAEATEGKLDLIRKKLDQQVKASKILDVILLSTASITLQNLEMENDLVKVNLTLGSVDLIPVWEQEIKQKCPFVKSIKTESVQRLGQEGYQVSFQISI